jgi:hypothetical protein
MVDLTKRLTTDVEAVIDDLHARIKEIYARVKMDVRLALITFAFGRPHHYFFVV